MNVFGLKKSVWRVESFLGTMRLFSLKFSEEKKQFRKKNNFGKKNNFEAPTWAVPALLFVYRTNTFKMNHKSPNQISWVLIPLLMLFVLSEKFMCLRPIACSWSIGRCEMSQSTQLFYSGQRKLLYIYSAIFGDWYHLNWYQRRTDHKT